MIDRSISEVLARIFTEECEGHDNDQIAVVCRGGKPSITV